MYISHITTQNCNGRANVLLTEFSACRISRISSIFGKSRRQSRGTGRSGPALFYAEPVRVVVEIGRCRFSGRQLG